MEWTAEIELLVQMLACAEATVLDAYGGGGREDWYLRILYSTRAAVAETQQFCEAEGLTFDVKTARELGGEPIGRFGLPSKQYMAVNCTLSAHNESIISGAIPLQNMPKNPAHADMGLICVSLQTNPMRIPKRLREIDHQEAIIREYEYGDTVIIMADFGPEASDISVDIVDGTAIVVVKGEQFEFELSDNTDEITTKNGVLTIEG